MMRLIATIILILIFATKTAFTFWLKGSRPDILEICSLLVLGCAILFALLNLPFRQKTKKSVNKKTKGGVFKLLTALCVIVIAWSFFLNLNKKALIWDAVALYDARAQFLLKEDNFTSMQNLSEYDPQNSYYYALYPPHTSIIHYFWYKLAIPLPVGTFYSLMLFALGLGVYYFANKYLDRTLAMFLTFLTIANNIIFSLSLSEYTNIPFTLQLFLGIALVYEFLQDNLKWKYIVGATLVVTSQWIRFLEPLWLGVVLAFLFAGQFGKFNIKRLFLALVFGVYSVLDYLSWANFVASFEGSTEIVRFNPLTIIEPVVGLFTGAAWAIFIFFVVAWGPILGVYLYSILISVRKVVKTSEIFLRIALVIIIGIYFAGLYFVSFQSSWWITLGGSLVRSSTFMVPLSAFLILRFVSFKKHA